MRVQAEPGTVPAPFREAAVDLAHVAVCTAAIVSDLAGQGYPLGLVADLGADAEGHGALAIAPTVLSAGAIALVVPHLGDALALRRNGVTAPVLCWLHPAEPNFDEAGDLAIVVRTPGELAAAIKARVGDIRLMIETGSGIPALLAEEFAAALDSLAHAGLEATGLVAALPPGDESVGRSEAEARARTAIALWHGRQGPGDSHRLDVLVFSGDDPVTDAPDWVTATTAAGALFGLTGSGPPAMTLWAPVTNVKSSVAGAGVSYGYRYRTRVSGHLALVSLGYGDGLDRAAGNVGPVTLSGIRYTISGRVAMDAHIIDLGTDTPAMIGDRAIAFGDPAQGEPAASEWAGSLGVTPAEITTRLSARVRRSYSPPAAQSRVDLPTVPDVIAEIDRGAFRSNLEHIRSVIAPAQLMVVIKANAYGHGRVPMGVAAVAAGIRFLGCLDIDTGLALRSAGIGSDTRIFAWLYPPGQHFGAATAAELDLGVSTPAEIERIVETAASGCVPRLHLEIDTGLNRNGSTAADWPALVRTALEFERRGLVEIYGAWTHIAEASEEEDTLSIERFSRAVAVAEELGARFTVRHLGASSAGLRRADARFDMVRMGGHCWGIPSFDGVTPAQIGLRPVMTLSSRVVGVRAIGDGLRAMVPVGFALGVPSVAAGRISATIAGRQYPVSAVRRDWIELAADASVRPGDQVVLFGSGSRGEQTVREWGDLMQTLGDEIVTRLSSRIARHYVD